MVAKLTSSRVAKCCYFCVEYLFVYNIFIWDFSNVIACLWFPLNTVHHLFLLIRTSEANVSRTAGYSCSYLKWSTSRTKSSNRLNFVHIRARSIWCTSFGTKVGARAAYRHKYGQLKLDMIQPIIVSVRMYYCIVWRRSIILRCQVIEIERRELLHVLHSFWADDSRARVLLPLLKSAWAGRELDARVVDVCSSTLCQLPYARGRIRRRRRAQRASDLIVIRAHMTQIQEKSSKARERSFRVGRWRSLTKHSRPCEIKFIIYSWPAMQGLNGLNHT